MMMERLKEIVRAHDSLKKENERLRKDYRESDWYADLQARAKASSFKVRELTEAVGRLSRQLIQLRNDG